MARVRRFFTNLFANLLIAMAVIISIIAVPLSVVAFLFTAATASSGPNEQYEPVIMFVVMIGVIGAVLAAWAVFRNRQRSIQ
jgi:type VI protein secretion system component VasK